MDMSAQWKGLHRGGACEQSHFFCLCCTVESKDVHHPNNDKCDRFCADRLDDDWKCYHHQIATNEVVENMKETIEQLKSNLSNCLETIVNSSKIFVFTENHCARFSDKNLIDYNPIGVEDMELFSELLYDELELRSLDMTGSLEDMRARLKRLCTMNCNSNSFWIKFHTVKALMLHCFLFCRQFPVFFIAKTMSALRFWQCCC
jgi:hypothetical protein